MAVFGEIRRFRATPPGRFAAGFRPAGLYRQADRPKLGQADQPHAAEAVQRLFLAQAQVGGGQPARTGHGPARRAGGAQRTRPGGAEGCSHGWSAAQPVESFVVPPSGGWITMPSRAHYGRQCPHGHYNLPPRRGGGM